MHQEIAELLHDLIRSPYQKNFPDINRLQDFFDYIHCHIACKRLWDDIKKTYDVTEKDIFAIKQALIDTYS
jgi:hypothetical protein